MNLTAGALPSGWLWTSNLIVLVLLGVCLHARPWVWLMTGARMHVFAGACIACMLLWSISGRLGSGPGFHLLGMTVLTLMFGPRLALLGAMLALLGVTTAGRAAWEAYGLNAFLMGAVPVAVSFALYRWVDRRLPNHFFVYVFVSAFVNGAMAMTANRLATRAVLWIATGSDQAVALQDYLLSSVLLSWGEALVTGMLMTMLVIYLPGWVRLFDDARYLTGR